MKAIEPVEKHTRDEKNLEQFRWVCGRVFILVIQNSQFRILIPNRGELKVPDLPVIRSYIANI